MSETAETYPLTDETVTLGRDVNNTIVLADKTASSAHAHVLITPEGWQIEDLNSTNGTLVNGQPIRSFFLHEGDRIEIGTIEIFFIDGDEPSDLGAGAAEYMQTMLGGGFFCRLW